MYASFGRVLSLAGTSESQSAMRSDELLHCLRGHALRIDFEASEFSGVGLGGIGKSGTGSEGSVSSG